MMMEIHECISDVFVEVSNPFTMCHFSDENLPQSQFAPPWEASVPASWLGKEQLRDTEISYMLLLKYNFI